MPKFENTVNDYELYYRAIKGLSKVDTKLSICDNAAMLLPEEFRKIYDKKKTKNETLANPIPPEDIFNKAKDEFTKNRKSQNNDIKQISHALKISWDKEPIYAKR